MVKVEWDKRDRKIKEAILAEKNLIAGRIMQQNKQKETEAEKICRVYNINLDDPQQVQEQNQVNN